MQSFKRAISDPAIKTISTVFRSGARLSNVYHIFRTIVSRFPLPDLLFLVIHCDRLCDGEKLL